MTRLLSIRRDEKGAAVVEMAFAMPILLLFVFMIFQLGVVLQANAGMQHALGEGARHATLFPKPANDVIITKMNNAVFGMKVGTFGTPTVTTPAASSCTNCLDLQVTYTVKPDFIFMTMSPITLTRTKRVYTAI